MKFLEQMHQENNIYGGEMKYLILVLIVLFAFSLSACSGNKAAEMFDTAKFEEVQNNKEHAIQLYEEIINKYPDSEYAKKAKERLSELKKDSKSPSK